MFDELPSRWPHCIYCSSTWSKSPAYIRAEFSSISFHAVRNWIFHNISQRWPLFWKPMSFAIIKLELKQFLIVNEATGVIWLLFFENMRRKCNNGKKKPAFMSSSDILRFIWVRFIDRFHPTSIGQLSLSNSHPRSSLSTSDTVPPKCIMSLIEASINPSAISCNLCIWCIIQIQQQQNASQHKKRNYHGEQHLIRRWRFFLIVPI